MPLQDFRWLEPEEAKLMDWLHMSDKQHTGYIVEVDLLYPSYLHEAHNSFPLAPEQLVITEDFLSPYAKGEKNILVLEDVRFELTPACADPSLNRTP